MSGELKEAVLKSVVDHQRDYSYEVLSEIALVYSTKMDESNKK